MKIITPLNRLVPYAAASEDFEVLLKNEKLLGDKLPIEMNGFNSHLNMKKAVKIGGESGHSDTFYTDFTIKHPVLMSFPSEVIWLGVDKGVDRFKDSFDWTAKKSNFAEFDPTTVGNYSDTYKSIIQRKYRIVAGFWKEITDRDQDSSRWLVSYSKVRFKYGDINQIHIFSKYVTPAYYETFNYRVSALLSQRINLAYGAMIGDYEDVRREVPEVSLYNKHRFFSYSQGSIHRRIEGYCLSGKSLIGNRSV